MTSLESHYALEAELPANPGIYLPADEQPNVCADCPVSLICSFSFTNAHEPQACMEQADQEEYAAEMSDRRAVMNGTSLY